MESFYGSLFLDMQERIKTTVPEINWIEQDFGQEVFDKWRPNVAFPAILIDFIESDYESMGLDHQTAETVVKVRLLCAPFCQSYEDAPLEIRKDALEYFDLEWNIVRGLHGWQPDQGYCQPLMRKSARSDNRNDIGLRIRELLFTTAYQEYFEQPVARLPEADIHAGLMK